MANTTGFKARVEYEVTDGTQTTYTFPFSYLRKQFVMVSILHSDATETALEYGVDYTVNDLSVSLTTPAQVGEHIIIYRQTSTDKIVTWNDGSILLARDMNTEDAQMLHLQEEQQDYITAHALSTKVTSDKEVLFDALNHRISNVSDPKDPQDVVTKHYMENVQGGFVADNTKILNDAKATLSATQQTQSKAQSNETLSKAWATSTESPDNAEDTQSSTGKTQSARSWALYGSGKAQEAAISEAHAKNSETNAKTSEQNAKVSETNAKTSETNAKTSETNAKTSETNAKSSEINASASASASASSASASATSAANAKTSETNAANSAKQAAESAGVFQDFKGATDTTDGNGGKVPKPLAGQQNKVLKADGTWGDAVTPNTLWNGLHSYPVNYVPADVSNSGWNSLGFCSIYYTQNKINNQPSMYGQLINIPADASCGESTQLWITQWTGEFFTRGGNPYFSLNAQQFKRLAFYDDVNSSIADAVSFNMLKRNKAYSIGDIAYSSYLPSWARLECVTAGTTAGTVPSSMTNVSSGGVLISDGTVTWIVDDVRDMTPVGCVRGSLFLPKGYIKANGATVQRADYPRLVQFINSNNLWTDDTVNNAGLFGKGDGNSTFVLPDYRERMLQYTDGSIGAKRNAGLPDIYGEFSFADNIARNESSKALGGVGGSMYGIEITHPVVSLNGGTYGVNNVTVIDKLAFSASHWNSIYGASATVQPPAINVIPIIRY